jgi:hypothetical protein
MKKRLAVFILAWPLVQVGLLAGADTIRDQRRHRLHESDIGRTLPRAVGLTRK